jgi:hypothetical protein
MGTTKAALNKIKCFQSYFRHVHNEYMSKKKSGLKTEKSVRASAWGEQEEACACIKKRHGARCTSSCMRRSIDRRTATRRKAHKSKCTLSLLASVDMIEFHTTCIF